MSKTLYHSALVKLGEVTAVIKSEPTKSKYEGKPPFVVLEIDGEEKLYNVENERCEGKLMLRKGQVLKLKATGGRENADIEILSGNGAEDSKSQEACKASYQGGSQPDTQKKADTAPPAQAPTVRSTSSNGAVRTLDTVATGFYAALGKADELVTQFFSDAQRESWSAYEAADLVLRVAAGLSIETNKNTR